MSLSMRRTAVVVLGSGVLASLTLLSPALGQVKRAGPIQILGRPGAPGIDPLAGPPDESGHAIQLPSDPKLKKKLDAAQDYMNDESWGEAVRLIQSLLDVKEDAFVPVTSKDATGKQTVNWVSVRSEANRLLGKMSPKGLEHYRLSYGATAKDLLNQAKTNNDPQLLAQVAERYLYTDAGVEATALIANYHLDRGRFALAALYFERLLNRQDSDKLSPESLLRTALAFHRISAQGGDEAAVKKYQMLEGKVWKDLADKVGGSLRLGDRNVSLATLRDEIGRYKDTTPEYSRHEWTVYRGNASRSAQGSGDKPFMEKRWSFSTIKEDETKNLVLNQAVRTWESRGQPVLPAFFPIAAEGNIIYRSYGGVHARNLRTGELAWETETRWSLDALTGAQAGNKLATARQWAQSYIGMGKPNILFENSTVGSLSTDNHQVYLVEDLTVPPPPQPYYGGPMMGGVQQSYGVMGEAVYQNKLLAIGLRSGKLVWEVGGKDKIDKEGKETREPGELSETYFLGPPLPMHGKLYVLTEKNQDLRLVCLDAARGDVSWIQSLVQTQNMLRQDVSRRIQAAHLAYGEGILVCPTNAGALLGVDLLSHNLLWAYPYREKGQPQTALLGGPGGMMPPGRVVIMGGIQPNPTATLSTPEWKVTAPVIQDGKVVFTAPDGASIHCVNLRDGTRIWKAPRDDSNDLYLAGVMRGKVVVVGKKETRALSLADGKQLWHVATGVPSGQGVASDDLYYLPLKDAEVCAIDVERGAIRSRTKSRKKDVVPGNLLLYDGDVVSQTVSEVAVFPQLSVKKRQMDELIAKNPEDPVGLTERGELELNQGEKGDLQRAVNDLRLALTKNPPKETLVKARNQLYEALTVYLDQHFSAAEKYLDEYQTLCKVEVEPGAEPAEKQAAEAEQRRRQAHYLCLVASGHEGQGRLIEAFQHYQEFADLSDKKELLDVTGDQSVKAPADVWAQGRIAAMMAKATPEQREPLEKLIAKRWQELEKSSEIEGLRKFVAMFGSQFRAGREARMALAERLMEESGNGSLLEAERQLLLLRRQLDDPPLAARAVEALARLMARKGLLEDAAYYYRVLGRDFPHVTVRAGKTGAQLLDDLATDKRFLPYLEEPGQVWNGGKFTPKEEHGAFQQTQNLFHFEPDGEALPFFRNHSVALELNFHQFRLLDRQTGEVRWQTNLTRTHFQNFIFYQQQPNTQTRFPYNLVGHVVVLNLGHMVFGLDPINQKVLWEKNLLGMAGLPNMAQVMPDPRDGTLQVIYQDGWIQKLGQAGPVEAAYVALQTRDGLLALDPISGRTLWMRSDVSARIRFFGDDQFVYVVETNQDGTAGSTRVLRAADGVAVKDVPDFANVYQQRQRLLGRRILASETAGGKLMLRLYDVPTGKDVWRKDFASGATLLHSEETQLDGVVEPDGKVVVFDVETGKEVVRTNAEAKDVDKAQGITLLGDRTQLYLAINGPRDPNVNPWGGPWSNFMPSTGLRSVPVNGKVYAFQRDNGKLNWIAEVPLQMLIVDQFHDLPILLCASRYNRIAGAGGNRWMVNGMAVHAFDKRTGKIFDRREDVQNGQQFHTFSVNPREGKIELISYNMKITYTQDAGPATAEAGRKDPAVPAPGVPPGNAKPKPGGGLLPR